MRDDREKKDKCGEKEGKRGGETRQDDINFIDIALLVNINQTETESL